MAPGRIVPYAGFPGTIRATGDPGFGTMKDFFIPCRYPDVMEYGF